MNIDINVTPDGLENVFVCDWILKTTISKSE